MVVQYMTLSLYYRIASGFIHGIMSDTRTLLSKVIIHDTTKKVYAVGTRWWDRLILSHILMGYKILISVVLLQKKLSAAATEGYKLLRGINPENQSLLFVHTINLNTFFFVTPHIFVSLL